MKSKIFNLTILIFLSIPQLNSQNISAEEFVHLARESFNKTLDSTYMYLDSAIVVSFRNRDTIMAIDAITQKSKCASYVGQFTNAYKYLVEAKVVVQKLENNTEKDSIKEMLQYEYGVYQHNIGDLYASKKTLNAYIEKIKNKAHLSNQDSLSLQAVYHYMCAIEEALGNPVVALNYIDYNRKIKTQYYKDDSHPAVMAQLCNLASFQLRKQEYENAIANFQICIPAIEKIYTKTPSPHNGHTGGLLCNFVKENAECQLGLGNTELAIELLNKSRKYKIDKLIYYAKSDLTMGLAQKKINQNRIADKYFKGALSQANIYFEGAKHPEIAKMYLTIGAYYLEQNSHNKALENFQMALIQLVHGTNDKDVFCNPDFDDLYINDDLIKTFRLKTIALHNLATANDDSAINSFAFKTGKLGIQLLAQTMAERTRNEHDVIGIVGRNYSLFEEMLSIGKELKLDTELFPIVELSKSASLLKSINLKSEINNAEVPQDFYNEYYLKKNELTQLEKEEYKISQSPKPDKFLLAKIGNKIFETKQQLNSIQQSINGYISQNEPNNKNSSLLEIQKNLNEDQTTLEYFIGEKHTFVFIIKKDTVHFKKLNLTNDDLIAAGNLKEKIFGGEKEAFIPDAYRLYDVLLKPIKEKYGLTKKLIIIPDGPLYYLPFEVLLTGPIEDPKEFGEFPYLIHDHTISYCFSSTMLENLEGKTHIQTPVSEVLAFGPSFTNTATTGRSIASVRGDLNDLKYNKDEIEYIKEWFYSDPFVDTLANKHTFLKLAGDYRFIHLATHAKVDDKNPDFSYIAFTNGIDTNYLSDTDFKLTINELSALNLNADMVVLSACETGVGKVYKGEGIISISRGFIEAGAKSILTTLWNIDDKLSSKLMENFYKHLSKENKSKDEALCDAKREYLLDNFAFQAHPKFWAAFVPYGDMSPVEARNYSPIWLGGLCILLFIFGLLWKPFWQFWKK